MYEMANKMTSTVLKLAEETADLSLSKISVTDKSVSLCFQHTLGRVCLKD